MRRIRVVVLSLICSVGAIVGVAAPSYAGTEDCMKGWACIWEDRSYEGSSYGTSWTVKYFDKLRNKASSAAANGASCSATTFYTDWNIFSGGVKGHSFTLNSKTLIGHGFRDPNLSNGAGRSTRNFEDDLESLQFTGCA